jgi:hypothetical protein
VHLADLARAKRLAVLFSGDLERTSGFFGSNGASFGARQALHAFGVDDVESRSRS